MVLGSGAELHCRGTSATPSLGSRLEQSSSRAVTSPSHRKSGRLSFGMVLQYFVLLLVCVTPQERRKVLVQEDLLCARCCDRGQGKDRILECIKCERALCEVCNRQPQRASSGTISRSSSQQGTILQCSWCKQSLCQSCKEIEELTTAEEVAAGHY